VQILPRQLVGVTSPDISATLLGSKVATPVFIPPMAAHGLAHASAEKGEGVYRSQYRGCPTRRGEMNAAGYAFKRSRTSRRSSFSWPASIRTMTGRSTLIDGGLVYRLAGVRGQIRNQAIETRTRTGIHCCPVTASPGSIALATQFAKSELESQRHLIGETH